MEGWGPVVRAPFAGGDGVLPPGVKYLPEFGVKVGRVFSYNRVSLPYQAKAGQGLLRQIQDSEDFCRRHGLELDTSLRLVDAGKSAYKGDHLKPGGDLHKLLELAEAGSLGPYPLLIIEALDRISRLAMFDTLNEVLLPLFRYGVTILSLEDNEFYDQRSISVDGGMRMMRLVIRIEEANRHSRRLQHRMQRSWEIHRSLLREGIIKRPRAFCPAWCDYSEQEGYTFNEKVKGVQRAFELLKQNGYSVTARLLNKEGYASLSKTNTWTKAAVQALVRRDQVFGAIRLQAQPTVRYQGARRYLCSSEKEKNVTPWQEKGEVIEGFLPVAVPKDVVLAIRTICEHRSKLNARTVKLPNTSMHWFAQRLTYCTCGQAMSNQANWCSGERRNVRYLRCTDRTKGKITGCTQPGIRMEEVALHVLTRLKHSALALLLADHANQETIEHLRQVIRSGEAELHLAKERQKNFIKHLSNLMEDGQDVFDLMPRRDQIKEEIADLELKLTDARVELLGLESPPGLEKADQALDELREALATGESTAEQRCAANNALWDLGITVHINSAERLVALRVGDGGPLDWQPLLSDVAREALAWGMSGVAFQTDAKDREIALEVDP